MVIKYPNYIDDTFSIPTVTDNVSQINAESINNLRSAIIAIESELGVKPSGIYGTVLNRLYAIDLQVAAPKSLGGDATGTTAAVVNTQTRGLKSATTTINVDSSPAPTSGQALVAVSDTSATWQTISSSGGDFNSFLLMGA